MAREIAKIINFLLGIKSAEAEKEIFGGSLMVTSEGLGVFDTWNKEFVRVRDSVGGDLVDRKSASYGMGTSELHFKPEHLMFAAVAVKFLRTKNQNSISNK